MKLNMQDTLALANWLRGRATLAEVARADCYGAVGNRRFSERARERFTYYWTWSAMRHAARAGQLQDAMYARGGIAALNRRFERVARVVAKRVGV